MRKIEEKIKSIKVYVQQWLYEKMSRNIRSAGRFRSDDSYLTDLIDISFFALQKNGDGPLHPSKIWWNREKEALFSQSYLVYVRKIAELFVIPICAGWIAFRCHATKLSRVQLGAWSIQLDNSIWYLFIGCGGRMMMNVSLKRNFHDIFQWHFIRDLKIVDSIIPWLKNEVQNIKKQVTIDWTIEKIEKAGKNPTSED